MVRATKWKIITIKKTVFHSRFSRGGGLPCHACHLGKNPRQLGGEAVKGQREPRPFFFSQFIYVFLVALGLLSCSEQGLLSGSHARVSHSHGVSCGASVLGVWAQVSHSQTLERRLSS